MDALAGLARQAHQAFGRQDRRLGIAHHRVAGPIAVDGQAAAFLQPVFILGMEGGAAVDRVQHALDALIILDQKRAGGGAHEHFHAAASQHALHLGQHVDILVGGAGIEGVVAMHAALGAGQLVQMHVRRGRGRIGIRHLEDRRHPAQHGAQRARLQVFLPLHARFAEMHLGVDHARHHGQARTIDHLSGGRLGQVPDLCRLAIDHADVRNPAAIMVHHLATLEDQVEGLAHHAVLS